MFLWLIFKVFGEIQFLSNVYGANASGKSNLVFAIFDIVQHLTDNESKGSFYQNYLTKPISIPYAEFEYCFKFEQNEVVYRYSKTNHEILLDEFLSINKKELLSVKRTDKKKHANSSLRGAESLNQDIVTCLSKVFFKINNVPLIINIFIY
jgi:AAA15 family ATPase/GTPase